uniref:Uncharacterized protein n=1 Tax=Calcidiscus leptoporus TaxID=127549 RepID=A0A7S0P3N4_9EUKA
MISRGATSADASPSSARDGEPIDGASEHARHAFLLAHSAFDVGLDGNSCACSDLDDANRSSTRASPSWSPFRRRPRHLISETQIDVIKPTTSRSAAPSGRERPRPPPADIFDATWQPRRPQHHDCSVWGLPRPDELPRRDEHERTRLGGANWAAALHTLGVLLQMGFTILAFSAPVFERAVIGALPDALRANLGIDFNAEYNMLRLAMMAAQAGGLDYFMSATFWVFIVVCPTLRPLTQLLLLLVPLRRSTQRQLHRISRHMASYYAFEVMLVAVPLTQVAFGPMSSTMLNRDSAPEVCIPLLARYPNGSDMCFKMDIVAAPGYFFTIVAVAIFLLSGFDGSPTHKYLHRKLYPDDRPPPTCASCS